MRAPLCVAQVFPLASTTCTGAAVRESFIVPLAPWLPNSMQRPAQLQLIGRTK